MGYRPFKFETQAGDYWTVIDDQYEVVEPADMFLQYLAFSRRLRPGTLEAYSRDLVLYFSWTALRGSRWDKPDVTAFQVWLRTHPSPTERRVSRKVHAGPGANPVRSDNVVDRICMVVCEMFRHLVAQEQVAQDLLTSLYEVSTSREGFLILDKRRHRLKRKRRTRPSDRAASIQTIRHLMTATKNIRDFFLVLLVVSSGLRRGEALGLRISDMHLMPSSRFLGCDFAGAHIHVVPRVNSNRSVVKGGKGRIIPVSPIVTQVYALYRAERDQVAQALDCDFVFVNLFRQPLGEPMKLYAVNELFARLSCTIGFKVVPHALRHAFASETIEAASLDVVRELMGHAHIATTEGYLHPSNDRLRAAVEGSSLFNGLEPIGGLV